MFVFSLSLAFEEISCEGLKMQFYVKDTCEIFCCGKEYSEGCGAQIAWSRDVMDYSSNRMYIIFLFFII